MAATEQVAHITPDGITQATVWRTQDGETFDSREEAEAHKQAIEDRALVARYLEETDTDGLGAKAVARKRNVILAFLGWRATL